MKPAPGSVIKPGVALAFQRAGVDEHDSIVDEGFIEFGGRKFRDWKRKLHKINMNLKLRMPLIYPPLYSVIIVQNYFIRLCLLYQDLIYR